LEPQQVVPQLEVRHKIKINNNFSNRSAGLESYAVGKALWVWLRIVGKLQGFSLLKR
jgi:hypothetical protein